MPPGTDSGIPSGPTPRWKEEREERRGDIAFLERFLDAGVRAAGVMLTTDCNLRCEYCCQVREPFRRMSIPVLDEAVRQLLASGHERPRLTLMGGEPLLVPDLVWYALDSVARQTPQGMRPDIHLATNGLRLDDRTLGRLVNRNVHVDLSFDGLAPAQDDRSPGSFDLLDRLLLGWRSYHPDHFRSHLSVKASLTARNAPHLAKSFRYFLRLGVRDVDVVPVITHDPAWDEFAFDELDRQLEDVVEASIEEQAGSGEIPFLPFRSDDVSARLPAASGLVCGAGRRDVVFVDVDGQISPCAAMAASCLPKPPGLLATVMKTLGGLRVEEPGLSEKLLLREREAGRLALLTDRPSDRPDSALCGNCIARPRCLICPVSIAFYPGSRATGGIPPNQCDFNRLVEKYRRAFHAVHA